MFDRCSRWSLLLGAIGFALLASLALLQPAEGTGQDGPREELLLTILHTSDEHSSLIPAPVVEDRPGGTGATHGGYARLATVVEEQRRAYGAAGVPVLLTSAGDFLTGTAFAWLALEGEAPELRLKQALGYDVVILGNHEFDYGPERLADYLAAAGYPAAGERTPLLATNTRPPERHPLGERGLRRTHLVTLSNGLRVGFIGLLGEGAERVAPLARPVEFEHHVAAARAAVEELRSQGAQLVVAVTHAGLEEDRELARAVPAIHLILGGHDHRLLDGPVTEGRTLIVHPGAHLRQVARLELSFAPATGALRLLNDGSGAAHLIPLDSGVPPHPGVAELVRQYRARLEARVRGLTDGRFAGLDEPVARSQGPVLSGPPLTPTGMGALVTDAMRAAGAAATGQPVDFAVQANGVIRADLLPGEGTGNRGEVALYDVLRSVGMGAGPDGGPGYPLVSVWLTGREVRNVLEVSVLLSRLRGNSYFLQVSGLRAGYDPGRAVWGRIPFRGTPIPSGRAVRWVERETAAGWLPLEPGDTALYHLVTDRYLATFLPVVGQVVPRLAINPRDRAGRLIEDLDDAILRRDGRELKVWQAVVEHMASLPAGADGMPAIPAAYLGVQDRLREERGRPLLLLPGLLALLLLLALIALVVTARRRRRPLLRPAADRRSPSGVDGRPRM